jgi:hypothetical protein
LFKVNEDSSYFVAIQGWKPQILINPFEQGLKDSWDWTKWYLMIDSTNEYT